MLEQESLLLVQGAIGGDARRVQVLLLPRVVELEKRGCRLVRGGAEEFQPREPMRKLELRGDICVRAGHRPALTDEDLGRELSPERRAAEQPVEQIAAGVESGEGLGGGRRILARLRECQLGEYLQKKTRR